MGLFILQPGIEPLGQLDFLDTDLDNVLGGEIGVPDEATRTNSSTEKASADARDGYVANAVSEGTPAATRSIVRIADGYSTTFLDTTKGSIRIEPYKVFYLLDDGKQYYGTLFGEVLGSPTGLGTSGTRLGPHTAAASGKVTCWDKMGLYAVSLNALSADVVPTASGNLYDTPLPGEVLYREHNTGKLTRTSTTEDKIAMFVELTNNRSLVNTPAKLVGATEVFDRVVIEYFGAYFNAGR